ncbi:MAG: hypothetical protein A2078_00125 [Nitrospirae bacterium GWC2_57_9]|nr:MAG: hypothetical protein A2078_00125 [Nitrospirae bacterium GWC2_57_9]
MFQNVDLEIHIQVRPIEMIAMQQLNILNRAQGLLFKIRILLIGEEIFLVENEQPDTVWSTVFNAYRSAFATL